MHEYALALGLWSLAINHIKHSVPTLSNTYENTPRTMSWKMAHVHNLLIMKNGWWLPKKDYGILKMKILTTRSLEWLIQPTAWRVCFGNVSWKWSEIIINGLLLIKKKVKLGSQYDAGASVALRASECCWNRLDFYSSIVSPALTSIHKSDYQKLNVRNKI